MRAVEWPCLWPQEIRVQCRGFDSDQICLVKPKWPPRPGAAWGKKECGPPTPPLFTDPHPNPNRALFFPSPFLSIYFPSEKLQVLFFPSPSPGILGEVEPGPLFGSSW